MWSKSSPLAIYSAEWNRPKIRTKFWELRNVVRHLRHKSNKTEFVSQNENTIRQQLILLSSKK